MRFACLGWFGVRDAMAAQVVDAGLFDQYVRALKAGQAEPFAGDEFAPTDEGAHVDFARRLGLRHPDEAAVAVDFPSGDDPS